MPYVYEKERPNIFTEDGFARLTNIREYVLSRIKFSGAVLMDKVLNEAGGSTSSWDKLACVDYLIERGEIREVKQDGVWGQHRIFVAG